MRKITVLEKHQRRHVKNNMKIFTKNLNVVTKFDPGIEATYISTVNTELD